jgi:dimeric dUTPase (all-alpha-NTP-PPase superfamily)
MSEAKIWTTVEVIGKLRKVLNEEIYNLHSSLIISVMKPRISWAGHVASMEYMINTQFVGIYERGREFEKPKQNHRIILRWILIKRGFIWVRTA